jgi:hypothetical protein
MPPEPSQVAWSRSPAYEGERVAIAAQLCELVVLLYGDCDGRRCGNVAEWLVAGGELAERHSSGVSPLCSQPMNSAPRVWQRQDLGDVNSFFNHDVAPLDEAVGIIDRQGRRIIFSSNRSAGFLRLFYMAGLRRAIRALSPDHRACVVQGQ